MIIKTLPVGMIGTNCYVVACPDTKKALVIDPGDEGEVILAEVKKNNLEIIGIVNTHGHWDHIGANQVLKNSTGAPLMIHHGDAGALNDGRLNLASMLGKRETSPVADVLLNDGDGINVGTLKFQVAHTPGHTPGGICLIGPNVVFAGDTLFQASIGRTDFPGGSYNTLITSIKEKLLTLDDDVVVYPGHGPSTTIGYERRNNPFLT